MSGLTARRTIGWCVGLAYAAAGARAMILRRLKSGARLPVVVHALPADELDRLLGWLEAHGVLDRLWLTFDDGWLSVGESVPVLEKYNVRAKVFIAPGETIRGRVWTSAAIGCGIPAKTWRGWYALCEADRYDRLFAAGGARAGRELLSVEEVVALSKHPLIEIENHTWSHLSAVHRPLPEVVDEVRRAQTMLAEWTGRAPGFLAWPFGRGNAALDRAAREMGLVPVYTRQGYEVPLCRNMAIEDVSFQENLGRVLGAWPKVGETL